jgi:hypothetical protein
MAALEDLADLKGLKLTGGLQKSKKGPGPKTSKIKLTTKPSDHAPKDVKHVFKAGQR